MPRQGGETVGRFDGIHSGRRGRHDGNAGSGLVLQGVMLGP